MGWLEERQLPRKEENEKSHKCEWSQGEWNFLLLCKKEGFMRQVSKTERDNSFFFFSILFLTAPCLHCCARVFSSCSEWGTTLRCSAGGSHPCGLSCCGAQAPGTKALRAPALGLSSCNRTLGPPLENNPEIPPSSRDEGLRLMHGLETNLAASLQTPQEA